VVSRLKKQKKRIVFTNGCFDLLHTGHVRLFEKARSYGDVLIVAVNGDASLRRLKGPNRPLVPQKDRCTVLAALAAIDYVTVFNEDTPWELLRDIKPHVVVKGGDYKLNQIVGREFVDKVWRFRFVQGKSTTGLIERIVERYGK
jgi:D-beta-D-heptose 7-phosphate kinase/D-beta-D-heptose 1-phosphate adenosyltransferase